MSSKNNETEVFEIDVQLRQNAVIAVEAESREEAWEALRMPHDREVSEELIRTDFKGAEYEPIDIISVGEVSESDISIEEE